MKRACLYQASGLMIIQACDVTLTINEKIISYEFKQFKTRSRIYQNR